MDVSSRPNTKFQIKSISLPCRSHPSTLRINEELTQIKTSLSSTKPSADTLFNGLSQLAELYRSVDNFLDSLLTQNLVSRHQNEKLIIELMDGSVKFLDVCSSTREVVLQMKEHVRDLQCALRRRKVESSIERSITEFNCFRKKLNKVAKRQMGSLKPAESINSESLVPGSDHHLTAVIRVLTEVSEVTISMFESLLIFLSMPVFKPVRPKRLSLLVSRWMHKGTVACQEDQLEGGTMNELESVGTALLNLLSSTEVDKIQAALGRLEGLEAQMERIESGLEFMFRRLIRTRASLLNIMSQ